MSPSTAILRPDGIAKQRKRRRHGGGIGVVAFVDDGDTARLEARATAFERREILQRRGSVEHIAIQQRHGSQRAHDILGDMGARRADKTINGAAQNVGLDPHARRRQA